MQGMQKKQKIGSAELTTLLILQNVQTQLLGSEDES